MPSATSARAKAVIGGVEQTVHYFVLDLPHSDACFVKAYPAETTEAFCDGHVSAFSFLGGVPRSILYDNTRLAVARILGDGRRKRTRVFSELVSHYLFEDCDDVCGPPRPGSDPFEDWHHAFNRICRLESRWRRKCLWHGEQ